MSDRCQCSARIKDLEGRLDTARGTLFLLSNEKDTQTAEAAKRALDASFPDVPIGCYNCPICGRDTPHRHDTPPLPAGLDTTTDSSGIGSKSVGGLDFEKAERDAKKVLGIPANHWEMSDEMTAAYNNSLNAQVAEIVRAAREEEGRRVIVDAAWAASEETERIVRAQYAPLVALVRGWRRLLDGVASIEGEEAETYDAERHRKAEAALLKAQDALAAFEIPEAL